MPRLALIAALPCLLIAAPALAQPATPPTPSHVDYAGFVSLSRELADYRGQRLVHLDRFQTMAGEPDTLILDARSAPAFAAGHIEGAVNLPFTDFTSVSLAAAIGDPNRRILIYCNNNFRNDAPPVMLKSVRLALNIQTFINLVGYGYRNVYELADTVDFNDPQVRWVKGPQALAAAAPQAAVVEAMKPPPSTRSGSPAS